MERVSLNSICDNYILISAAVRGIPLPKSSNKSFHVSHDASLIFESWMPTQRPITEYPHTAISIILIFHFQWSSKGSNDHQSFPFSGRGVSLFIFARNYSGPFLPKQNEFQADLYECGLKLMRRKRYF